MAAGTLLKQALILLVGYALLNPEVERRLVQFIHDLEAGFTSGITGPVTDAWVKVAVIAAGLGFAIWLVEAKAAKSMGQTVAPPAVASIGVAQPPSFGGTGGLGFSGGKISANMTSEARSGGFGR